MVRQFMGAPSRLIAARATSTSASGPSQPELSLPGGTRVVASHLPSAISTTRVPKVRSAALRDTSTCSRVGVSLAVNAGPR
jgi:hypothetical protein